MPIGIVLPTIGTAAATPALNQLDALNLQDPLHNPFPFHVILKSFFLKIHPLLNSEHVIYEQYTILSFLFKFWQMPTGTAS